MSLRLFRTGWRIAILIGGLIGVYLVITFFQVWSASRADSHDPADAIIVLGAAQYDGIPSPVLQRRLDHALELYDEGYAPRIVVTGGKRPGDRFTEAAASYRYLRAHGVPEDDILREEQGGNTWQQLAASKRFLANRGIATVILVSDDYHALRLARIADEVGLDAQVSPVDSGLSFAGSTRALVRETVAVSVGRLIGFRRLANLR
jgi:uncharacterized SAM-binding protein YcdF (DUF218 family)